MRPSKYDKYICIACLVIFLYSFFILGGSPVYESDRDSGFIVEERDFFYLDDGYDELVGIEYPTSVFIAPVACLFFFSLMVFERPLRRVDRHWVKKKIVAECVRIKKHVLFNLKRK